MCNLLVVARLWQAGGQGDAGRALAAAVLRAYRSDFAHFAAWGGRILAEPAIVASYLAAHAETLSIAPLVRRIATILKAHEARGVVKPTVQKSSAPLGGR
jgi:hypothetical protein